MKAGLAALAVCASLVTAGSYADGAFPVVQIACTPETGRMFVATQTLWDVDFRQFQRGSRLYQATPDALRAKPFSCSWRGRTATVSAEASAKGSCAGTDLTIAINGKPADKLNGADCAERRYYVDVALANDFPPQLPGRSAKPRRSNVFFERCVVDLHDTASSKAVEDAKGLYAAKRTSSI